MNWSTWNTNLGIINEDPGCSGDLKRNPSYSIKPGRGEGFRDLDSNDRSSTDCLLEGSLFIHLSIMMEAKFMSFSINNKM